jgi:uncharacterized protein
MQAWTREGTEFLVVAREKDITTRLMDNYGIPYMTLAPVGSGLTGQFGELIRREFGMLRLARKLRPKVITGTSVHAARIARLVGARSVVMCEDDAKYIPLFKWLAYPFAHAIVTPDCLKYENHGTRHFTYPAYQKLFYLHPNRFTPDSEIQAALGLPRGARYALVRLSSLQAHHDIGARGLSEQLIRDVIKLTAPDVRLFISSEKQLGPEFEPFRMPLPPERMHDVLAGAEFLISDSQSMTVEAALLGTPAFKINSFAGIISVIRELEQAGLAYGYKPGQESELLCELSAVLETSNRLDVFQNKRAVLLKRKIDPLPWFLELIRRMTARESMQEMQAWSRDYVDRSLGMAGKM